ncbi:histidine--tRNA ligase [Mycoplasma sp. 'Moose RK']|uniref:histidine--tRNA ligase n=1 Tax=Mycoplasma sp. 'Moose RK' TaxID=2780095 RepID=UPI0018C22FF5|nr:histidine--tRNA ligase [Mycoplasma sp. 'Moose RK']MBG0730621.1 histidine--tRNA ligase [Mycoplasma sp. 'Moose RK']
MSTKIVLSPKGTYDLFGENADFFLKLRQNFFELAKKFNFSYIETPIFEYSSIFTTSGQNSDIVTKELYQFCDLSGRKLALRPEGTAPIMRAISQHKLHQTEKKFFYFGPMFRYENPQKGRFRQFYQAGFEITNFKENSLKFQILEIINLACQILANLKINNYQIKVNYLADLETRIKYIEILSAYFEKFANKLEPVSQIRIKNNPLRILDDKVENQKDFVKLAPKISDFFTPEQLEKFNSILKLLDEFKIQYKIDHTLVRGLDYYDEFVFEIVDTAQILGSKLTIIGGGCYNSLPSKFNLANFKSIGMAFGIERMMEIFVQQTENLSKKIDFFLLAFNPDEIIKNFQIAELLRKQGFQVELNKIPLSVSKGFQVAKKTGAKFVFFFEKEQRENCISLKNTKTGKNIEILFDEIKKEKLREILNGENNV